MQIKILAVGKKMPNWIEAGIKEYTKRMPKNWEIVIDAINLAPTYDGAQKAKDTEAQKLLAKIKPNEAIIALDVLGKSIDTFEFEQKLQDWQQKCLNPVFLIGGPEGLGQECLDKSYEILSLSNLTLPHTLARLLLCEQIYRCWSLSNNLPYHR